MQLGKINLNDCPVVIADLGINHGGSIDVALKLAELAIESGVHIIKHQTHFVDDEMSHEAKCMMIDYIGESIYELMNRCALRRHEEVRLKEFVESGGGIYISTPFSRQAALFLNEIGVPAFKIGSGECSNYPFIEYVAAFGKPIVMSTGMNTIESIARSVDILRDADLDFALLHTTNSYPTPVHLVRLKAMLQMQAEFNLTFFGLSDHTESNIACISALTLGARVVERHFTDSKCRTGPDIRNSMTPSEAKELVRASREIPLMLEGTKGPVLEEESVMRFAFASVVSNRFIRRGEEFSRENLWCRRPSGGDYGPDDYYAILGRKAARDIPENVQVRRQDVD